MFLRSSDIFQPRKSVRSSLHRASIVPDPKSRTLAYNVHSLCMHPPVAPEYTTQTIRHRWPVLCPNLPESRQYLSQTLLAEHLLLREKSVAWPDSTVTLACRSIHIFH